MQMLNIHQTYCTGKCHPCHLSAGGHQLRIFGEVGRVDLRLNKMQKRSDQIIKGKKWSNSNSLGSKRSSFFRKSYARLRTCMQWVESYLVAIVHLGALNWIYYVPRSLWILNQDESPSTQSKYSIWQLQPPRVPPHKMLQWRHPIGVP